MPENNNDTSIPLFDHQVTHAETSNATTWKEALAMSTIPKNSALTKTLIFKPKVAKSETAVLIMVVALDATMTSASLVAKAAQEKEARFASADVVKTALGVTVEQSPFNSMSDADDSLPSFHFSGKCKSYSGTC